MAVPKCASSSVKRALAELDPQIDTASLEVPTSNENSKWHAVYPTQRFRPHRWEKVPDDWFGFTVVRDPLKRLIACYTDRVVTRRELHNSPRIRSGQVNLPADPDPDFFLQNLGAYRDASSVIKHHTMHIWLFTGPKLEKYQKVYKIEDLETLRGDLAEWTQTDVAFASENKSDISLDIDDLSDQTLASLGPWLREEYAFLKDHYAQTR
ncbi:hypothetical protein BWR18_06980 [Tateyamaria omphalii]|uniref:Sulfotransferase family protein n=2 Tax=Tateyamaria omphalii TaxID=299262 RepID=A0A1P8MTX7_9RHOB|nr:hypothetical protein BWR18_06980 [Tateyamaria omphalii]